MIKILKKAYDQIQNKKSSAKIINKIISIASNQKKIDYRKCAVYKIFSKENMSNVFTQNFVKTMKKNNFKDFNDKNYLIQLLAFIDLKTVKKEVKNIFFVDKFINKGHDRINKTNKMKIINENENDGCYNLQFYKTRKKLSIIMDNSLFALEEEIKINNEKLYLNRLKTKKN